MATRIIRRTVMVGDVRSHSVRWLVVGDLPASALPWTCAYLRKTGEWTLAACNSGPDEPDSGYFMSEAEARGALEAAPPPEIQDRITVMGEPLARPSRLRRLFGL